MNATRSDPAGLPARLGYPAHARLLILNCDDLGSSHAANLACLEAVETGIATSATLMVPCPWAKEAAELFRDRDVGVHLTLTSEYPGYRWRALTGAASLHDSDGCFPRTSEAVWAKADLADVARECRAQVDQALAWGLDVTHLDSHMGTLQLDPRFFDIYLDLAQAYRLPLRMSGPRAEGHLGFPARPAAEARGLLFPDDFIFRWKDATAEMIRRHIPRMAPGVLEMIVHPVRDSPELRAYDLEAAQVRVDDLACATSPDLAAFLAGQGVHRISYRPLRDLQRGGEAPERRDRGAWGSRGP